MPPQSSHGVTASSGVSLGLGGCPFVFQASQNMGSAFHAVSKSRFRLAFWGPNHPNVCKHTVLLRFHRGRLEGSLASFSHIWGPLGSPRHPIQRPRSPRVALLGIQVGSRNLNTGGLGLLPVSSIATHVLRVPVGCCGEPFGVFSGANVIAI